jgi:hypothetical protein
MVLLQARLQLLDVGRDAAGDQLVCSWLAAAPNFSPRRTADLLAGHALVEINSLIGIAELLRSSEGREEPEN